MTRTISLITATVGAALLFAVPAWADNWGADRQRQQPVCTQLATFDADGFAQAIRPSVSPTDPVRDDRFHLQDNSTPTSVSATSSGTEIEWGQIGIGFGIGLVLALGLYLAMRFTQIRRLAH